ncbi:hepatic leukemia factor-like [Coccinella septempunctata]|uniref:hepatic leukemia factor-like n=1 Tax=Coccinella septempunctata TaxID=41139 RepID=UPI001D092F39|nr:hepatic leukemia factor-like [Coccinella septempunctata]
MVASLSIKCTTQYFPNRILQPQNTQNNCSLSPIRPEETHCINHEKNDINPLPVSYLPPSFFGYQQHLQILHKESINGVRSIPPSCTSLLSTLRRQRGEKKPIPEDLKDEKYYERRKRNNQAAKKSRDARKMREDQVALRATILEHENAILRAQVLTLREETSALRRLLLQKKTIEIVSGDVMRFSDHA